MAFQITLCKFEECSQPVPDSLNKGVRRLYCSPSHQNLQNQRNYRRRLGGAMGDGLYGTVNGHPYVRRIMAPTAKVAERRFKAHLTGCVQAGGSPCAGRTDPYDRRHLCLIKAVLREDWDQLRRAEQGTVWARIETTETGFWATAPEAAFGTPIEASEDLAEFTEAGGGTPIITV
jgi:hypothetical protein